MKSIFLSLMCCCISVGVSATEIYQTQSLDLKSIKDNVTNPESDLYFEKLIKRYKYLDETFTADEYQHVYYGFSFTNQYVDSIYKVKFKQAELNAAIEQEDWQMVKRVTASMLEKNPVHLNANYFHTMALERLEPEGSDWKKYQKRWNNLLDTIGKSGSGTNPGSPIVVITVDDEYHMMQAYYEIEAIKSQNCCDSFNIQPSKYFNNEVIYFDISQKLIADSKLFPGDSK